MKLFREQRSTTFADEEIDVQFVLLHYTAVSLKRTLEIFLDPNLEVSCHLVIDESGSVHEIVECWDGRAKCAWHAGPSRWQEGDTMYESLNKVAIGIELVNPNGNVFEYSPEQIASLGACLKHLGQKYPAVNSPKRLLGHEQVAGHRGKIDPGHKFPWQQVCEQVFPGSETPVRESRLPNMLLPALEQLYSFLPEEEGQRDRFSENMSLLLEQSLKDS